MSDILTMSVSGIDSEGFFQELTRWLAEFDTEVIDVKAIRSDGLLSALVKVSHGSQRRDTLVSGLADSFPNLQFFYSPVEPVTENIKVANRVTLVVDCKNRPGIREDLERVMSQLAYQVENCECTRCHVAGIGETVFSARYSLIVPDEITGKAVADEVEALAPEVRVKSL